MSAACSSAERSFGLKLACALSRSAARVAAPVSRGADGDLQVAEVAAVGEDALLVHDAHRDDPSLAFALSRLVDVEGGATPIGIFRQAPRETGAANLAADLLSAQASFSPKDLSALLHAADTWSVGA